MENDLFGPDHLLLAQQINSAAFVTGVTPALFMIAMQALFILLLDLELAVDG